MKQVSTLRGLAITFALFLLGITTLPAVAQNQWDWWPDPATHRGISSWISYSSTYDTLWSDPTLADQEVGSIAQSGVEVVFLLISSSFERPDLQRLSDRTDPFSVSVQYLLNDLSTHNILACAAILSDDFTGSDDQMQKFVLVDNLLAFNAARGQGDAAFTCVATNLEMHGSSNLTSAVYDLWKQFHTNMKNRILTAGGGLRLLVWMQGPDYLIGNMSNTDDQRYLMQREGITQNATDPKLYDGAFRYFTTQASVPIFDAVVPMWFFTPSGPYYRRVDHSISELQTMGIPNLYLIPGMAIVTTTQSCSGLCCPGTVNGRQDYESRLGYDDSVRQQSTGLIGTGVFKWPIPPDWTCQGNTARRARLLSHFYHNPHKTLLIGRHPNNNPGNPTN